MLEPSIDSLQRKINSKYTLVTLSAKRARQMSQTKKVLVDNPKSHKYVGMALEEVQAEKLFLDENNQA
ncbi:MAG: DNA-directed RNA polymerase subunit omega [Bacillota bacterium]|uniref:DNA-directed RNA polymerase subunit omega n=1 Tax=Virgibacillus salarius TaxID=447199 RepID=A0A941DQU0_9BACI|nr:MULTISPECIES: DNA-directed RNA polymerase subunit omega [Bacillaceae]NAZ08009.1 DNA-directed RNA polymerase subunit omega [Agaribacter marinus]MBR7795294.1 DNA-directed RNA polymerase subunit omega [Virgibacillus salarius]MCC2251915.1 DNA-directed RNA polymerase subunit omega [Virgibacillus sp. AGTR]MDY7045629.1 DNA-directed RNA polymerase subunit omega [Virgibacillus sp. M23]QRZ17370.1 DNA-directed RNA polymerase subunit omega [Virgibacillus sp. AGTR]